MKTKKIAEDIIGELDSIGRECDPWEYGLPMHGIHQEEMINIVSKIIDKHVKREVNKATKASNVKKLKVNKVYQFFKIQYKNCLSVDYDYTICKGLSEVKDYMETVETDLGDTESEASVTITGIEMTDKEYDNWIKKTLKA